jgi:hypothetical protein
MTYAFIASISAERPLVLSFARAQGVQASNAGSFGFNAKDGQSCVDSSRWTRATSREMGDPQKLCPAHSVLACKPERRSLDLLRIHGRAGLDGEQVVVSCGEEELERVPLPQLDQILMHDNLQPTTPLTAPRSPMAACCCCVRRAAIAATTSGAPSNGCPGREAGRAWLLEAATPGARCPAREEGGWLQRMY